MTDRQLKVALIVGGTLFAITLAMAIFAILHGYTTPEPHTQLPTL